MSFEEFLFHIRKGIGNYCTDEYWRVKYDYMRVSDRDEKWLKAEMPFFAVNAVATDYTHRHG